MTRTIAVANQKGGVGKTTTVATLGAALAERGAAVLVVDLDPQACLTFSLGLDPEGVALSVYHVMLQGVPVTAAVVDTDDRVDLLPATIELAGAEAALVARAGREHVLRHALTELADAYDFVLIDCSPSLGVLTINALTAAGELLVPLQCETLAHRGVGQLLDTVADVRRLTNPSLRVLGVLPTLYDGRTLHARGVLGDIGDRYGVDVLDPIARSIRFAEAPAVGRSILASTGTSRGADDYRALAGRLLGSAA
ncbi:MAG: ParA family protein [Actinomycetota bacterium]|nr:MAG: ParA family protein [Actinomycetota bacterium]